MKLFGFVSERSRALPDKWAGAQWSLADGDSNPLNSAGHFRLLRADTAGFVECLADLAPLPQGETGRDEFMLMGVRMPITGLEDQFWVRRFRATCAEKMSSVELLRRSCAFSYAHLFTWRGGEPFLVLFGDSESTFEQLSLDGIFYTYAEMEAWMEQHYPPLTLMLGATAKTSVELIAETPCDAEIYWETTGGALDFNRTFSGKTNVLRGKELSGVKVKVGFRDYTGLAEIVLP